MEEINSHQVFIIPKETRRRFNLTKNCLYFDIPDGKYQDIISRKYVTIRGARYKMPIEEVTPYEGQDKANLVIGKNIVVSILMGEKTTVLSRKQAIINLHSKYKQGDIVDGIITGKDDKGIFIAFGQGLIGHCLYKEVTNLRYSKSDERIQKGTNVYARIIMIRYDEEYPKIYLSIKKATCNKKATFNVMPEIKPKRGQLVSVKVGEPLKDGTGSYCEIAPTQIGIMDKEPEFEASVEDIGKEAWAVVKRIRHYTDEKGCKREKYKLEFICWRDEIF